MRLVPLSAEHVQGHPTLPFHVYAEDGRLLLPANARLQDPRVQARLQQQGALFVQPHDYDAWRRGVAKAVDGVVQSEAPLVQLARMRPDLIRATVPQLPGEEWEGLVVALHGAMQLAAAGKPWLERVAQVCTQARQQAARRVDEALFHYIWSGAARTAFYSGRQALRCMFIAGEMGRALGWDEERLALLDQAALTMNVAAWQLQDQLARYPNAMTNAAQRAELDAHAGRSAQLLRDAGVTDTLWLQAVQHHADEALSRRPPQSLEPGLLMAALLRRVDRYGALMSRRLGRKAQSSTQAAQRTCLGADGRPDALGAALLKSLGLYPPGSFVSMASRETGIVLARGASSTQPLVACLLNADGMAMAEPRLRNTVLPQHAVRAALRADQVNMDPPLDKLQALRAFLRAQAAGDSLGAKSG